MARRVSPRESALPPWDSASDRRLRSAGSPSLREAALPEERGGGWWQERNERKARDKEVVPPRKGEGLIKGTQKAMIEAIAPPGDFSLKFRGRHPGINHSVNAHGVWGAANNASIQMQKAEDAHRNYRKIIEEPERYSNGMQRRALGRLAEHSLRTTFAATDTINRAKLWRRGNLEDQHEYAEQFGTVGSEAPALKAVARIAGFTVRQMARVVPDRLGDNWTSTFEDVQRLHHRAERHGVRAQRYRDVGGEVPSFSTISSGSTNIFGFGEHHSPPRRKHR